LEGGKEGDVVTHRSDSISLLRPPITRFVLQRRLFPVAFLVGCGALLPAVVLQLVGLRALYLPPLVHFLAVGLSACAATFAALTLSVFGTRRRDAPTVLVGTAFATMGALLAVHGFSTPGILAPRNGLVSFSAGATIPVGGVVLALAVLPGARRLRSI